MKALLKPVAITLPLLLLAACATRNSSARNYMGDIALARGVPSTGEIVLLAERADRATTPQSFEPPVEITIVAKTDSTNLRLGYAADQVIFNWELDPHQLRVDGGPADGQHKPGKGLIPVNQFVTIKWVVTAEKQILSVDGEQRLEHTGDYRHLYQPISVFPAANSHVTLKSLRVRQLE